MSYETSKPDPDESQRLYVRENYKVKTFMEMRGELQCTSRHLHGLFKALHIQPLTYDQVEIVRRAMARARLGLPLVLDPPKGGVRASAAAGVVTALDFMPAPKWGLSPKRKTAYIRKNEPAVTPDPPKPAIVRPAAVYSNSSPYGIAADYLLNPQKYEAPQSDSASDESGIDMIKYGASMVSKKTFASKMNNN